MATRLVLSRSHQFQKRLILQSRKSSFHPTPSLLSIYNPHKSIIISQYRSNSSNSSSPKEVAVQKPPILTRIWTKAKEEASHYWHGTKLLGKEIKISARLQWKLLHGGRLTRREKRQLKRTTQDLLRLIPFSVFVIVPFMEFLLPVALKLFPNMLPSTFTDQYKEEEKKRKLLKVRLEMAKFLQETLRESGVRSPEKIRQSEEFKEFFRKVRATGEKPSTDDIVKVARLFEDDLTLDNLSRPQLVSMCRYMNINAFGTDNFLRHTIRNRMKELKKDDQLIDAEGVSSLSPSELIHACASRGIRTPSMSTSSSPLSSTSSFRELDDDEIAALRSELEQWIELHLKRQLSGTLLILSKAFAFTRPSFGAEDGEKGEIEGLRDTLASLPHTLLNETELAFDDYESASYKKRLEVLQEQEELIEDEAEQEEKEEEARKLEREREEEAKRIEKEKEEEAKRIEEEERRQAQAASMLPEEEKPGVEKEPESEPEAAVEDVRMTQEQVSELGEALLILSAKSVVLKERADLAELIKETEEAEEESGDDKVDQSLIKRIKSMIQKIDKQLEDFDKEVGSRFNLIHLSRDGKISVEDLRRAFTTIKHRPSDEAIDVLIAKLDTDKDNFCPLTDILELMEHPEEGLGVVVPTAEEVQDIGSFVGEAKQLKKDVKPRKEDIVED